jgi:two-component sensor histidine kinase
MWTQRLAELARNAIPRHGWAVALALFTACLAGRFALAPWMHEHFVAFAPAVLGSTALCGWRKGAAVLALSTLAGWFFFLPPVWSFGVAGNETIVPILAFVLAWAPVVILVAALSESIRRLREATDLQDALFRELQHRVANNMQFVSAMLEHARRGIQDETGREVMEQASARITSMAMLHRRVSDRASYEEGIEPVLRDLLAESFRGLDVAVSLDLRARGLSFEKMTSAVLLVSEAATNAVKHVFRPGKGSLFEVSLLPVGEGKLRLCIRDDGPGAAPAVPPPPGTKPSAAKLGARIMVSLASQLGGTLEVSSQHGTTLSVEFAAARCRG